MNAGAFVMLPIPDSGKGVVQEWFMQPEKQLGW
jgi:hypothetical protein